MGNDAKRTPGKWHYSRVVVGAGVFGPKGELIARICPGATREEQDAYGRHIVQAHNAHDALMVACELALGELEYIKGEGWCECDAMTKHYCIHCRLRAIFDSPEAADA